MAQQRHTPEPCKVTTAGNISAGGRHLCTVWPPMDIPVDEGWKRRDQDTAFIAEAFNNYDRLRALNAELLALLRAVIDADYIDSAALRDQARAAIAKAGA